MKRRRLNVKASRSGADPRFHAPSATTQPTLVVSQILFCHHQKTNGPNQGWANLFTRGLQWVLEVDKEAGPGADGVFR